MMNILYFHSNIWCDFFAKLLLHYLKELGAKIIIACGMLETQHYADSFAAGAIHFLLPNLEHLQEWEKNSAKEEELIEKVGACEYACGKVLGRIILSAERNFGRMYSNRSYYWPKSSVHNACRRDNSLPQRMALRAFHTMFGLFDLTCPDLVLSRAFNESFTLPSWMIAKQRGIPMFAARFSKALSGRAYWTDDFHMYNAQAKKDYWEKTALAAEPKPWALAHLDNFRNKPQTVRYIRQNWANRQNWLTSHINLLGRVKAKVHFQLAGGQGKPPKDVLPGVVEYYRGKLMEAAHRKYFRCFDEKQLASLRYFYFPMHKEPELMLNFEAPLWHDQFHMVKYLSSMLPAGYCLMVREHRFNWGRRFGAYFEAMRSLPGVILVNPFDPQFKYIRHADLIVTDNGSTGWEGILLQKPVMTLERTFYDVLPQANRVEDATAIDQTILGILSSFSQRNRDDDDRYIATFLEAEFSHSIEIEQMHADIPLNVAVIEHLRRRSSHRAMMNGKNENA